MCVAGGGRRKGRAETAGVVVVCGRRSREGGACLCLFPFRKTLFTNDHVL